MISALFVALVISLVGTVYNVNKLNELPSALGSVSGFATSIGGKVNLTVASTVSITLPDSNISFGDCAPSVSGSTLSSNVSTTSWGATGICTVGGIAALGPDNITIQNDGNDDVNISVRTSGNASQVIGGTNPYMYFAVRNDTLRPGCFNLTVGRSTSMNYTINSSVSRGYGFPWEWINFTPVGKIFAICENLSYVDTADSINLFVQVFIPSDSPVSGAEQNATLTFSAAAS